MFWASLLLVPALACASALGAGAQLEALQLKAELAAPGQTRLRFTVGGAAPVTLLVARDPQVPARAPVAKVEVLAVIDASTVVLVDRYRSRLNNGQGQCGAGDERFLRVVRIAPGPPKQTYSVKLASCWQDIELDPEFGAHGLQWAAEAAELRIEWLSGPKKKPAAESLRLHIGNDGSVEEIKPA